MAIGDLLVDFSPLCNEPPATGAATPDVRNGHLVLCFHNENREAALFTGVMPWHYSGGAVAVILLVSFGNDAAPAQATFELSCELIVPEQTNIDQNNFATLGQLTVFAPAVAGCLAQAELVVPAGILQAGQLFRLRTECDPAASTFSDRVELHRILMREVG